MLFSSVNIQVWTVVLGGGLMMVIMTMAFFRLQWRTHNDDATKDVPFRKLFVKFLRDVFGIGPKPLKPVISACKNPNCARCQRYKAVQSKARARVRWIVGSLTPSHNNHQRQNMIKQNHLKDDDPLRNGRIEKSVLASSSSSSSIPNPWQNPTLLMVSNLQSREIVTDMHTKSCTYLQKHPTKQIVINAIQSLFRNAISSTTAGTTNITYETPPTPTKVRASSSSSPSSTVATTLSTTTTTEFWTVNDSPKGKWEVLQILNQGVWNQQLVTLHSRCRQEGNNTDIGRLLDLVRNIPGALDGCLFGNVLISKIYPGTIIEPHCGPTNIRHRLQYLIQRPPLSSSSFTNHTTSGSSSSSERQEHGSKRRKTNHQTSQRSLCLRVGPSHTLNWDNFHDDDDDNDYDVNENDDDNHKDLDERESSRNMFVFDDSFVHSVDFPERHDRMDKGDDEDKFCRIVLIVDLWHPDLTPTERILLRNLYPPMA